MVLLKSVEVLLHTKILLITWSRIAYSSLGLHVQICAVCSNQSSKASYVPKIVKTNMNIPTRNQEIHITYVQSGLFFPRSQYRYIGTTKPCKVTNSAPINSTMSVKNGMVFITRNARMKMNSVMRR